MPHTPIKGYRELTPDELVLINNIKQLENHVGKMMNEPTNVHVDGRMGALAKTNL